MAVHQVEEYYVYMENLNLTRETRAEIEEYLSEGGYTFQDFSPDGHFASLVIGEILDEHEGHLLEDKIREIIGGQVL